MKRPRRRQMRGKALTRVALQCPACYHLRFKRFHTTSVEARRSRSAVSADTGHSQAVVTHQILLPAKIPNGKLVQRERKAVTQQSKWGIWECTFVNLTVPTRGTNSNTPGPKAAQIQRASSGKWLSWTAVLDGIPLRDENFAELDENEPSCLLRGALPLSPSIPAATAALVRSPAPNNGGTARGATSDHALRRPQCTRKS